MTYRDVYAILNTWKGGEDSGEAEAKKEEPQKQIRDPEQVADRSEKKQQKIIGGIYHEKSYTVGCRSLGMGR